MLSGHIKNVWDHIYITKFKQQNWKADIYWKKVAYSKETEQKMLASIAIYNFEKILGFLRIPWYVL